MKKVKRNMMSNVVKGANPVRNSVKLLRRVNLSMVVNELKVCKQKLIGDLIMKRVKSA